jgi:hypothetical protein
MKLTKLNGMNSFINMCMSMVEQSIEREIEMCAEFKRRAELDKQRYWDACKYPRKIKKRIRKEALADYNFHMMLSKPMIIQ